MRVEHGWIRVWLLSNLGTRQFLVQHLRWCEEVIVDHSESSMKKGDAPGGRSDGDFTWLTKPNVDGMCTSSWIGMQLLLRDRPCFSPVSKSLLDSMYLTYMAIFFTPKPPPQLLWPQQASPAIEVKAVCAQRFGTDLHLGAGLGS